MIRTWWKEGVIYQIYPRSFKDSNGDGIGDLRGIIEKLDYLADLGIDIIWLSPIYQSPNDDNGYDISDYYAIMPEFGTLADFDQLLAEAHRRGLKIVLDLVVNHSSDEHEWFQQSRRSRDNPYRDYYFWKPEKPNNWRSFFGGDVWEYDEPTGEYYLHLFSKKQPDLNWENPRLRQDIYRMMRWWLDKGVDGFRMDVIPFISKNLDFPDAEFGAFGKLLEEEYANGPRVHEFLREMHREVLSHYDIVTVGEAPGVPPELALDYVGEDRNELQMIFHFGHMKLDWGPGGRFDPASWDLREFKAVFNRWDEATADGGWISIFLDNHDFPRLVSRWGNDREYHRESAKLLALLLLTMRGTPSIYQGSEIGMTNVDFPKPEDYRDIQFVNYWQEFSAAGGDEAVLLRAAHLTGRDNARTPMQWNKEHHAGFTSCDEPWIKVNPNYERINIESEQRDPDSILHFYRRLLRLRPQHPTLIYGHYEMTDGNDEKLYAYRRWNEEREYRVYLNFSEDTLTNLPLPDNGQLRLLMSNYAEELPGRLRPWEARLYVVEG